MIRLFPIGSAKIKTFYSLAKKIPLYTKKNSPEGTKNPEGKKKSVLKEKKNDSKKLLFSLA